MYSKEALAFCRTDQIMADAAYALLTKNSRTRTGEFLYDEDILKQDGITDYDQYLVSPGINAYLGRKRTISHDILKLDYCNWPYKTE